MHLIDNCLLDPSDVTGHMLHLWYSAITLSMKLLLLVVAVNILSHLGESVTDKKTN